MGCDLGDDGKEMLERWGVEWSGKGWNGVEWGGMGWKWV